MVRKRKKVKNTKKRALVSVKIITVKGKRKFVSIYKRKNGSFVGNITDKKRT